MKKTVFRIITLVLTLVLLVSGTLSSALKANAGEFDDILYTDLFYGYDTSYLGSGALKSHHNAIDKLVGKIYNDYCDSDDFKWTAAYDGIKAALNLSEFYKLMSDTYGNTDYKFEDSLDKANVMMVTELLNCSANYAMADRVIEGVKAVRDVCELFEESNDVNSMSDGDLFLKFFDIAKGNGLYNALGNKAVNNVLVGLQDAVTQRRLLSYVSDGYEAVKVMAIGMMMENLRMEIIDDIIANSPSDYYIHQGMTRLKQQLIGGFDTYFLHEYVSERFVKNLNEQIASKLGELVFQDVMVCFNVVTAVFNLLTTIAFDLIMDVPTVDDLTVQKVLDEYSTDLYLVLTKNKIPQFDKQFDSSDIGLYEAVFTAYLAANKAALKASEPIALDHKAELEEMMNWWGSLTYDEYIYDVQQTIAIEKEHERKLKLMDGWNLNKNMVFREASDDVEEGCTYLFQGKLRANVQQTSNYTLQDSSLHIAGDLWVKGTDITLTVPEGKTLRVDGNVNVNWDVYSSAYSHYSYLELGGTLYAGGDFTVGSGAYYTPAETSKLYVAGNYTMSSSRQKSISGSVIFNGITQQSVFNLQTQNVTVTNPEGLLYKSVAAVYGHYALNGNPLDVGNSCTAMFSTTTFDDSNFVLVKPGGTVILNTDVKADVVVDGREVKLIIAAGSEHTIDGNLHVDWAYYPSAYTYDSYLELYGTLHVTGDFTIGSNAYYISSETAKLYVAGNYTVIKSSQSGSPGTVIFNGTTQQSVYDLIARDVTVTNPEGLRYQSDASVSGHYALNGNPLDVGNSATLMTSTTTFDNSDFVLVKPSRTATLNTDVKADVVVEEMNARLIIAAGSEHTIDGNLYVDWAYYPSAYTYDSYLELHGTLHVTGDFTVGSNAYYISSETAKLYVAGNYTVIKSSQSGSPGTVIFNGTTQQSVYDLIARDVTVTNPEGLRYQSDASVSGHYALNGNPLDVGNSATLMTSTTTFDDSDFVLVKIMGSVTLGSNVSADVKVIGRSSKLIIPKGCDYTIGGDLLVNWENGDSSTYCAWLELGGTLRVTGNFTVNSYGRFMPATNSVLYVGGNYSVYSRGYSGANFTLILNGTQLQKAAQVKCNTLILENPSKEGVQLSTVSCTRLFDHKGNVFALSGSNSFVDYDGDGILDNADAMPTVHKDAVKEGVVHVYANGACVGIYSSLAEALLHYDPQTQYVKLMADLYAEATLSEDLYIDLNGNDLTGLMQVGENKVYALDSTTNEYSCNQIGKFTCVDENGIAVVPVFSWQTAKEIMGAAMQYAAILDTGAYSFHRYSLEITHISLKPDAVALGYKAVFAADPMLQQHLDAFGFTLQLRDGQPVTCQMSGDRFVSMRAVSLRLQNYDVERFGEAALEAQVFMRVDGQTLCSTWETTTMQTVVEAINDHADTYNAQQLSAVEAMLRLFRRPMQWRIDRILQNKEL